MAISCRSAAYLLVISAVVLLTSPASGQTCRSDAFSLNFQNCEDLPTLRASLHWTYRSSPNPTLSIAFTAPPAAPGGWVAWGLNPRAAAMVGTQALLAFTDGSGSLVVNTYNLTSTSPDLTSPSAIDYDVLNRTATISGGRITIFSNLSLPAPIGTINQAWQVGRVLNGVPMPHDFNPENFASVRQLNLVSSTPSTPSPSSPSPTTPPASSPSPIMPPTSSPIPPSPMLPPPSSPSPSPSSSPITPPPPSLRIPPSSSSGAIPPPPPSGAAEILARWVWVCGVSLAVSLFGF